MLWYSTLPDLLDITRNIRQNGQIDIGANEWTTADPVSTPFVVRVKPNGNDANDGSNWTSAKRTIQAAIDYAFASGGGEVWVKGAPGLGVVYNEAISLKPFVHVYGGFDESDNLRSERNWRGNLTAIDAVGWNLPVVTVSTLPRLLSTLDGFTIAHGQIGIYLSYGSATIAHNIIKANTNTSSGAGVCASYSSPIIANNWIVANAVLPGLNLASGGGMYISECQGVSVVNNTVVGNIGVPYYGTMAREQSTWVIALWQILRTT